MCLNLAIAGNGLIGCLERKGAEDFMTEIFQAENLVALLTLVLLEIVLGIDNVIFIAILSGKLPESQQARARSNRYRTCCDCPHRAPFQHRLDHEADTADVHSV